MDKPIGKNMQPANLYAVVTMLAFVLCVPIALALEWKLLVPVWESAVAALTPSSLKTDGAQLQLVWLVVLSGLTHYLNNEVHNMAHNTYFTFCCYFEVHSLSTRLTRHASVV
jgi:solute carrier family 35, member E1